MATDKERIEKLKRDLGNAFSDVNTLKTTNTELKTKNDEIRSSEAYKSEKIDGKRHFISIFDFNFEQTFYIYLSTR